MTTSEWQLLAGGLMVLVSGLFLILGFNTGEMKMLGAPALRADKNERPAFFLAYAVANGVFLYLGLTIIAAGLSGGAQ